MKTNFKSILLIALVVITLFSSCKRSAYTELVSTELDKNIVNDSLLFGLKLGDTKQQFFDKCWKLNKEEKVKQGPRNNFVQYQLPLKPSDSIDKKMTMLFYGIFDSNNVMTGFDMKFYYDGWSLWNKSLHSDKLVPEVANRLLEWFPGNEFIEVKLKKSNKTILVKVDGTRQIVIEEPIDSREVDARIDDLRFVKGIN